MSKLMYKNNEVNGSAGLQIIELTSVEYSSLSNTEKNAVDKVYVITDINQDIVKSDNLPVGLILPYGGNGDLPVGFLRCDGAEVSRTMYPDLFNVIGTAYGAGDGVNTFNLPDLEDLMMQGASLVNPVGTYKEAGLPNIEGTLSNIYYYGAWGTGTGALKGPNVAGTSGTAEAGTPSAKMGMGLDASQSNPIYGSSDTVQPPAVTVNFIIKAFHSQTQNSALIDITQYAQDLAHRANKDLSNLSTEGFNVLHGYTRAMNDNHIYGFKIDKNDSNPATRVSYTDDAEGFTPVQLQNDGTMQLNDWEGTFILDAFRPVMLNYDGTVAYELDHSDQTKKLDGTPSDITDTSFPGNAMVGVKTLYLSCFEDANYEYCRVATYHVDDTFHAYAHIDRNGVIKSEVYLPMFEGSLVSSVLRSLAGMTPSASTTTTQEINYAVANGSGWYIDDFSNHKLIENLGILVSRSTSSQVSFGRGFVDGNSAPCTTGTLKDKGMFYGPSGGKSAVKLFYIENYYGSRNDRCAGVVNRSDRAIWIKPHPPYNTNGEGYFCFPTTFTSDAYGYITKMQMTDFGLIPKAFGGSESTYYADYGYVYGGACYGLMGCHYADGGSAGLSYLNLAGAISYNSAYAGASLSYK